jgi:hypothetical protein
MKRIVMAAGGAAVLLLCGALGMTALAQTPPSLRQALFHCPDLYDQLKIGKGRH